MPSLVVFNWKGIAPVCFLPSFLPSFLPWTSLQLQPVPHLLLQGGKVCPQKDSLCYIHFIYQFFIYHAGAIFLAVFNLRWMTPAGVGFYPNWVVLTSTLLCAAALLWKLIIFLQSVEINKQLSFSIAFNIELYYSNNIATSSFDPI